MFKKIVNFFFTEEEEYIHEEELNSNDTSDQLKVHPIKPFVNEPKIEEMPKSKPSVLEHVELSQSVTLDKESKERPIEVMEKRPVMINVDDPISSVREVTLKKEPVKPIAPTKYQPTEIISPIYGGPKPTAKVNPVSTIRQEAAKKTITSSVISPMYGAIVSENEEAKQRVDMNLDVKDMLTPERKNEEVQVSLYDYLEEIEKNG